MNKIAVLIANYNYGNFIQDAINSCVNQSRRPDFVIIVDDGSTDNSQEVIFKNIVGHTRLIENGLEIFQAKIQDIPIIFIPLRETRGPSFVRNLGIDISKSNADFYQILDADDIMHRDKLKIFEHKFNESQEIGVVYGDYDILNLSTGNIIREFKEPYVKRRLLEECIVHSGAMIRTSALLAVADQFGYYDVNMRTCEDYDLWLRISEKYVIVHVPESLTLVRVHQNNSTNSVKNEIWQNNWARIREKLRLRGIH
jgi:glycosyltransferase involved in cell wall biosynthesis